METLTPEREQVEELVKEETQAEPAATTTARSMFKYSTYIDLGDGAEECEHSRDDQCEDGEHFHAWCRLPNPYQHQDIRDKAMAAKARKIRELRDPESDASVVLDTELSDVSDAVFVEGIIEELLTRDFTDDYMAAQHEVSQEEKFEHIEQDREEYGRLQKAEGELPEDEQSEEFKRLEVHMREYIEAIHEQLAKIQEPKKQDLRDRPVQQLVELVRGKRVEEQADRAFMDTYAAWMWFVGTFKAQPHETLRRPHLPMWEEIGSRDRPAAGTMFGEAPEVVEKLREVFSELQIALQRASAGN